MMMRIMTKKFSRECERDSYLKQMVLHRGEAVLAIGTYAQQDQRGRQEALNWLRAMKYAGPISEWPSHRRIG